MIPCQVSWHLWESSAAYYCSSFHESLMDYHEWIISNGLSHTKYLQNTWETDCLQFTCISEMYCKHNTHFFNHTVNFLNLYI